MFLLRSFSLSKERRKYINITVKNHFTKFFVNFSILLFCSIFILYFSIFIRDENKNFNNPFKKNLRNKNYMKYLS